MHAPGPDRRGRGPAVCRRDPTPIGPVHLPARLPPPISSPATLSVYVSVCVMHATRDVPTAKAANTGTLDAMTADSAAPIAAPRDLVRTGGPKDDSTWLEHVLGWTLVVVVAMFVTQIGWL